jgi:hypothetical protein
VKNLQGDGVVVVVISEHLDNPAASAANFKISEIVGIICGGCDL